MSDSDAPSGKPQSYTRKTLGKSDEEKPKTPEVYKCCDNPQITYFGVVNLNIDEKTIGSVDVWRCGGCKKQFCEEKQLGIEEIAEAFNEFQDHTSTYEPVTSVPDQTDLIPITQ